jgi:hypothetical protein
VALCFDHLCDISKLFELKKYFLGVIGVLGGKISCYLFSVLKISITARV